MYKLDDENIAITGTVCSQIKETDYKYSVNIKLENKLKLTVYIDKKENVSKLEYEERIIITLYYLEKYTTKEIAKILHKNENTIKTKLSRGKKKIKRYLEEEK